MCGICGILPLNPSVSRQSLEQNIRQMTAAMTHRGPDSDGFHLADDIALGFRRLAIIDLATGDQPIYNEAGDVVTVFNGEIYNYQSLREKLLAEGHVFATKTDTETLVHGYETWGVELPQHLRGMFAFAIWDGGRLMLTRDRMGQKPLYYTTVGDQFVFASEIKVLLQHKQISAKLNREAIAQYLVLGYTLSPHTLFAGIFKLPPATTLIVEKSGQQTQSTYWVAGKNPSLLLSTPHDVHNALRNAVEMRLMSDVPLGTFLSGGVDSSAITAFTGEMTGAPVQTFTVGFDYGGDAHGDAKFNVDLHHAKRVADDFGSQHRAIVLKQDKTLAQLLPQIVYALDEPIADPAIMQTVFVTALARAHGVPVMLSGDGADEIFAGYNFFVAATRVENYQRIPSVLRQSLLNPLLNSSKRDSLQKMAQKSMLMNDAAHFFSWEAQFPPHTLPMLKSDSAEAGVRALQEQIEGIIANCPSNRLADRVGYARLRLWLADNSNNRFDKLAMWMSIEARSPFQDHELVDAVLNMPLHDKLPHKKILKSALQYDLPDHVLHRPKWGFTPPISDWLRTILRPLLDDYVTDARLTEIGLQTEPIQQMIGDHLTRKGYHLQAVWNILMLCLWHAIFIEGKPLFESRWQADDLAAIHEA